MHLLKLRLQLFFVVIRDNDLNFQQSDQLFSDSLTAMFKIIPHKMKLKKRHARKY